MDKDKTQLEFTPRGIDTLQHIVRLADPDVFNAFYWRNPLAPSVLLMGRIVLVHYTVEMVELELSNGVKVRQYLDGWFVQFQILRPCLDKLGFVWRNVDYSPLRFWRQDMPELYPPEGTGKIHTP
jgi:hypothetical protein